MYIVFYSVKEPQQTLLAINSLQKALNEPDYVIRLLSLKTMTSIAVKDISQVALLALNKAVKDLSPFVRKSAALALPKLFELDSRLEEEVLSLLETLLEDDSEIVIGSAFETYDELCPTNWDLIHPIYRNVCRLLQDMDEWSQLSVMKVLLRYAREFFRDPKRPNEENPDEEPELEGDHRLLLDAITPLLYSTNTAVSYHACLILYYCGCNSQLQTVGKVLMRLLHTNIETQFYVLDTILTVIIDHPELFRDNISEFFIRTFDSKRVRFTKLDILTRIASESNISRMLQEIKEYTKFQDTEFVAKAIQTIGKCAMLVPEVSSTCQQFLLSQMASDSQDVVAESVVVLKQLLQLENKQQIDLTSKIDELKSQLEESNDKEESNEEKENEEANEEKEESKEEEEENEENDEPKEEESKEETKEEETKEEETKEEEPKEEELKEETKEEEPKEEEKVPSTPVKRVAFRDDPRQKELQELQEKFDECKKRISNVVRRLARLINEVSNPLARASIIFVISEYAPKDGSIPPEILRIIAKSFKDENDSVKLEALTLAVKLHLSEEAKAGPHYEIIEKLNQYLFSLAKYDISFDIRDRARLLHTFIVDSEKVAAKCSSILFNAKPVPQVLTINPANSFYNGTISHLIAEPVANYTPLPLFKEEVPPSSIRDPVVKSTSDQVKTSYAEEKDDSALFGEEENDDEVFGETNDEDAFGETKEDDWGTEEKDEWGTYF